MAGSVNYISDVSDGEIVEDFEQISSEEENYFETVKRRVENQLENVNRRKIELELENTLAFDFGKENYHSKSNSNRRPSTRKRKLSNNAATGSRYESSRETARNRSYRASSVFSNHSIPRRRKREKARTRKQEKKKREHSDLSESEKNEGDSEDDEELLTLRLKALKSKQEVKELEGQIEPKLPVPVLPTEEENLRILALKSAVLKKKEFFKERKKQKMLENERPYSPSDVLPEYLDMSLSPLGSPFNEIAIDNDPVDMEISNDEKESSDMDVAPSPQQVEEVDDEEEIALRSLLLTSIHKKKEEVEKSPEDSSGTEQVTLAQSLKMVVQRLKQKKTLELPASVVTVPSQKSGTKTIAMILAEQKGKRKRLVKEPKSFREKRLKFAPENFLIRTIVNDIQPEVVQKQVEPEIYNVQPDSPRQQELRPASPQDTAFATITDTKNIPLLPVTDKIKKSRLVTSLESVIKPVPRLIIPVRSDDTDTDDEKKSKVRKTSRKVIKTPAKPKPAVEPEFEKNLENFLKNIRKEQEKKSVTEVAQPVMSSVKHLPKSAQVEYQQLVEKMKVLEEAQRKLKRTKVNSEKLKVSAAPVKVQSPKKTPAKPETVTQVKSAVTTVAKPNKIAESLSKIPQLDEAAKLRFIEKTENNFKNHSNNLLAATEQNLKLLADNEADMTRQEKLATQIIELEKLMKRYKVNLNVVNQRVKVNVHKIVQSSREMLKLCGHQKNFGKHICLPAGTIIKGESYSLPEHRATEIDENFAVIAEKTESIIRSSNDENVKVNMKLIADKVRNFVTVQVTARNDLPSTKDEQTSLVPPKIIQEIPSSNDNEESEVMKMIQEDSKNPTKETETPTIIEFPDVQKKIKGILDVEGPKRTETIAGSDQNVEKKLKYESPLDFLRLAKHKYGS